MLNVRNISKRYRTDRGNAVEALSGISFELSARQVISVLGASGCGKSTLLRIIAGIDRSDDGIIESEIMRPGPEMGFLQQNERLLPWKTALDSAVLGATLLGRDSTAAISAATALLSRVGLARAHELFPRELSGGMAQRVVFVRTLVTNPRLILMDEPFGQLDVIGRRLLAEILRDYVLNTGAAALLVTHSVEEAVIASDRIIVMGAHPGRVVARFALDGVEGAPGWRSIARANAFTEVLHTLETTLKGAAISSEYAAP